MIVVDHKRLFEVKDHPLPLEFDEHQPKLLTAQYHTRTI